MARKTFIAYKYSESQALRDKVIKSLGSDSSYYQGETADSPDLTDTTTENIKKNLKDMIYGTSVTIVLISPNLKQSKWVDWEIEYSLKEISREDKISRSNGIIGVIKKIDDNYNWLIEETEKDDGCKIRTIKTEILYDIINKNRFNLSEKKFNCSHCKSYDKLTGSYISLIEEHLFLDNPNKFIENAFEKSQDIDSFNITKTK